MSDDGTRATFRGEAHLQFIHRLGESVSGRGDLAETLEAKRHPRYARPDA